MVVDTSSVVRIVTREAGFEELITQMARALTHRMSVVSYVEACMVLTRLMEGEGIPTLHSFLEEAAINLEPVTVVQAEIAREAFLRFGKGRHPARLNFGDCFSYALAKALNEPLLFVGDDFSQTDIVAA